MGSMLNSEGGLTESQKVQADALGISHDKYRDMVIERLVEIRGGEAPEPNWKETRHVTKVKAKNPVLVVGHGPSFKTKLEGIRAWKHILVATDACLKDLLDNDIIPSYVITSEASKQTCYLWDFDMKRIKEHEITVIHSSITRPDVIEQAKNTGVNIRRFNFEEEPRCSNVGLFALNFCVHDLKADKIAMVGMEHNGSEYDEYVYKVWTTDFWYFVRKWPKQIIINCSEGGILYFKDHTLESTLDELEII